MAQQTANYGLHQWEPEDSFLRSDFNEDFQKIDGAIKGVETGLDGKKADKTALTSLETVVSGKAELVSGSYTGNGSTLDVNLGFRPRAVIIPGGPYTTISAVGAWHGPMLAITDTGFRATYDKSYSSFTNKAGETSYYIAVK